MALICIKPDVGVLVAYIIKKLLVHTH